MDDPIKDALDRLAAKGITATTGFSDDVLVVNVHETALDEPGTWAAVFTEFPKVRYCVKIG